jgi:inosine/xanthosine triphosphate pyrophosphatase family protein
LKLVEDKDKQCEFKEVLSYVDSATAEPKLFTRIVKGTLAHEISGEMSDKHWSVLALVFIPESHTKTMAAMDDEEYLIFRKKVEENSHFEQFGKYYSSK